jgi:hypothetical protein
VGSGFGLDLDGPACRASEIMARAHPVEGQTTAASTASVGPEHSTPRVSWMARCARRRWRKYRGTSVSASQG